MLASWLSNKKTIIFCLFMKYHSEEYDNLCTHLQMEDFFFLLSWKLILINEQNLGLDLEPSIWGRVVNPVASRL